MKITYPIELLYNSHQHRLAFQVTNTTDVVKYATPWQSSFYYPGGYTSKSCQNLLYFTVVLEVLFIGMSLTYFWNSSKLELELIPNSGSVPLKVVGNQILNQEYPGVWYPPKNLTVESFMEQYKQWCERKANISNQITNLNVNLCSCIPQGLVGKLNISSTVPALGEFELTSTVIKDGGTWQPEHCTPRERVAIIIPFRDRHDHLKIFLSHMHSILQRQELQYEIFVVEQATPDVFNLASMLNVGFKEALRRHPFTCIVFHDVDLLAEDDRNMYTCLEHPRHIASYQDRWNYKQCYSNFFGGATAFVPQQFQLVNGFSNEFYGWGGEDDDMYKRVLAAGLSVIRYPVSVSKYSTIVHNRDRRNPFNPRRRLGRKWRLAHYRGNGLNTLHYNIVMIEERPLYTWIYVRVPELNGAISSGSIMDVVIHCLFALLARALSKY